mmetsp:Transcript_23873/g.42262  ORF Transcript_23873/g.42262 Transcript_23873/m.42262 type:complete len:119 (-) Transcript_23873:1064-1420(-)
MSDNEDFGGSEETNFELRDMRRPRRKPTKSFNLREVAHRDHAIQKRIDQRTAGMKADDEARANLERLNIEHKRRRAAQKHQQARQQQEKPQPNVFKGSQAKLRVDYKGMLETLLKKAE